MYAVADQVYGRYYEYCITAQSDCTPRQKVPKGHYHRLVRAKSRSSGMAENDRISRVERLEMTYTCHNRQRLQPRLELELWNDGYVEMMQKRAQLSMGSGS